MQIPFYKYQGTGNDFVLIDNRQQNFPKNDTILIAHFCDRKFGVGADGLIVLEQHPTLDFSMVYYNADGNQSSMCGNGGRCIVRFAAFLGIIETQTAFMAIDGVHHGSIQDDKVALHMTDVSHIENHKQYSFLNTGSPHHVEMVANLEDLNVVDKGRAIRNNSYGTAGANINFVSKISGDTFSVRTYERGVENETLSCGTGATACALIHTIHKKQQSGDIKVNTKGGLLQVTYEKNNQGRFNAVYLIGPAMLIYNGKIRI